MAPDCPGAGHFLWRTPFSDVEEDGTVVTHRLDVWLCSEHFTRIQGEDEPPVELDRYFFVRDATRDRRPA